MLINLFKIGLRPCIWYLARYIRHKFNLAYIRLIGSISFKKVGLNCIFDGIPDIVYPFSNIFIGNNCRFGKNCVIYTSKHGALHIGSNTSVNNNCHITAQISITIGNNVLIAENVGIRDHDHGISDPNNTIRSQPYLEAPIIIEDNVWIGRNASILKGVRIGKGAVIGANAVVVKDVPKMSVNAGIPSRVIKIRGLS